MGRIVNRPHYRPDGEVDSAHLPAGLARFAVAALVVSICYFGMAAAGMVLAFWLTLITSGVLWAIIPSAVKVAHCRDRLLAGALGAASGLAGYTGYFHLDYWLRWGGPPAALTELPDYVAFRMATDEWRFHEMWPALHVAPAKQGERPARPLAGVDFRRTTWWNFLFDLAVLVGGSAVVGVRAASLPYSVSRARWCERETLTLEPAAGETFRDAIVDDTVRAWVQAGPRRVGANDKHAKFHVWYTPADPGASAVEAFAAVDSDTPVVLTAAEAGALTELIPGLRNVAGPALQELAAEAECVAGSAQVWQVDAPHAGTVQSSKNRAANSRRLWAWLVVPVVVLVPTFFGCMYILDSLFRRGLISAGVLTVVMFAMLGGFIVVVGAVYGANGSSGLNAVRRTSRARLRVSIGQRPSPLVCATDPRAVFAEMCPRATWTRGSAEQEEFNQGLLVADREAGAVLFEGDYTNYIIPGEAILSVDVEALPGLAPTVEAVWVVVVRAVLGTGTWEFPFVPLLDIEGSNNWERAQALAARIESVRAAS